MGAHIPKATPDQVVAALARRQHDVLARRQLLALGVGRGAIVARLKSERWRLVYRGVYATRHAPLSREGRFMAAVLACGHGAVLSHRSAGVLWGVWPQEPAWIEVSSSSDAGRSLPGLLVHRQSTAAEELTVKDGIPVTTPGRTLTDMADVVTERQLERAVDEADYLRLDCTGFRAIPGRLGSGRVTAVLALHRPGPSRTRSWLEERFLALCRRHGLPEPEVNVHVEGHLVDFVWRSQRLVVETDGHASHRTRRAFEKDPVRDADLIVAGYRPIRITTRRLSREPEVVAALVSRLLRA